MSFKKKKKPLPDVGPSYDDGKLSFSGREEMDDLTENEQRMLTFSEMEPVELATHLEDLLGALEDDEANVRNAALLLLRQLEPSLLARHALRISACLEDDGVQNAGDANLRLRREIKSSSGWLTRVGAPYFAFAFAASLTSRLKKAAVIPKARE